MRTDDDSEIEFAVVNSVASVTIDSDSLTENVMCSTKNRKRKKKHKQVIHKNMTELDANIASSSSSSKVG